MGQVQGTMDGQVLIVMPSEVPQGLLYAEMPLLQHGWVLSCQLTSLCFLPSLFSKASNS